MSKQVINRYKNRNIINREHRLTLKSLGLEKGIDIVILSAHVQKKDEYDWEGFVGTIQRYIYY